MKKLISAVVLLVFIVSMTGCSAKHMENMRIEKEKLKNWQQVRIEEQVLSKDCVYKAQDYCYSSGAKCYKLFKKRAALNDANTVVLRKTTSGSKSSGAIGISSSGGVGGFDSVDTMTALADFYYCPNYKFTGESSK